MTDISDIALAATLFQGKGPCNCNRHTKDHKPHRACPKCKGKGTISACLACGGSGWNAAANMKCGICEGRGYHLPPVPT
jgi:hypothetical protein